MIVKPIVRRHSAATGQRTGARTGNDWLSGRRARYIAPLQ